MSHKLVKSVQRSRPASPVHLYVDKSTPVHVYVEKEERDESMVDVDARAPGRTDTSRAGKIRRPRKPGSRVSTRPLARAVPSAVHRVRSMSPPWVPPPGKTSRNSKSSFGSFWNEEEADFSQQERYEQQINDLLNEVGELQEQLKIEKQREQLRNSHEALHYQEGKIEELKQEIDVIEKENHILRDSLDKTRSNMDLDSESEKLIQTLIEAELASERCAHQMQHVFDSLKNIVKEGHKVTGRDVDRLSTLFHDTESRLFDFKSISNVLRDMLKESQQREMYRNDSLEKDNNFLIKMRNELDENISKLELELNDKDKVIDDLRKQLASKNDETINFASTHESLESVKGHLQQQLKQKSGDCNRMSVQIRTLENELAKERLDKEHLMEMLKSSKDRTYDDRDALKKAARLQKQRALKGEETIQELTAILAEKERHIEQLLQSNSHADLEDGNDELLSKPLTELCDQCKLNSREYQQNLRHIDDIVEENEQLRRKMLNSNQEEIIIALKRENENLRSIADQCESRLKDVEKEMKVLRKTMSEDNDDQNTDKINRLSKILEKLEASEKSNQASQTRIEELEKKIRNLEGQNLEMKNTIQLKDSSVIDNRCKADDLMRENSSLMRQLEAALTDSRRNADNVREKNVGKDRQLQSRIHDAESQLAQQRAETNKWRRNCEEMERKNSSKLQDLKVQLEQAEITNRSLQTYVQFLKKSYANVFGDLPLSNGLSCPNNSFVPQSSLNFGGF